MPWNTTVLTRFTDIVPMPDGDDVRNEGVQYLHLRACADARLLLASPLIVCIKRT